MHTHVAWVKIKPYSSLAASLSPASVHHKIWQPFSQEARRGAMDFTAFPNQAVWRLGRGALPLCRSATRLGFPTDHKLCTDAGGLEFFWMRVSANRGSHPPTQTHTHTHTLTKYNPLLCAWNWESSADSCFLRTIVWQRVNIFWEFLFRGVDLREWKKECKKGKWLFSMEKWGIIACPCWHVHYHWMGLRAQSAVGLDLGERLTPWDLLRGLLRLSP